MTLRRDLPVDKTNWYDQFPLLKRQGGSAPGRPAFTHRSL
jgi:hypothetical protein